MSGSTVTRWVISDDGSQLIRREEVETTFPKGTAQESSRVQVKEENSDRPVTNVSSAASSSLSTNKRYAVPAQLPVSYPCSYCDICFTASHYLEKHVKRSHRKQYLEMLRSRNITFTKTPPASSKTTASAAPVFSKTPISSSPTLNKTPVSPSPTFNKTPVSPSPTFNKTPVSPSATLSKTPVSSSPTFSKTPVSSSPAFSKTPTSPVATYSKTPASPLATFSKTPVSPSVPFSKTSSSPSVTFSSTPASATATQSKTSTSNVGIFGPPASQTAYLTSPKSVPTLKSATCTKSQVAQASHSSAGPTICSETPEKVSDPAPVSPAPNSTKTPASSLSSGEAQITEKSVIKEASPQAPPQPLCAPSEPKKVKMEVQTNLSPCAHCGGRRGGESEGEGEEECSCEDGTLFLCNECGQSFPTFPSLRSHQDEAHWCKGEGKKEEREEEGETLYLCADCGLSFPQLDLLHHHQSLHDSLGAKDGEEGTEEEDKDDDEDSPLFSAEAHSCPNCQKTFKTARYLKTHMKIHSGQVPYHCDQCDKPFTQLGDLKTHRRTHTGERPYQCSQCGKCFGRSGTLKKHWRTHTGETPYVCTVCGKQFNQLGALKTHERIHTGQRPYFCSRCSQHFTYSYQLKRHRCVLNDKSRGASE
ncbi:hypothetical protein AGOR_G00093070 [Albula goreensis]|uniref:C2H2-type domain-containing protein n=1 Tax=Albula goreensis TaxID=1534307 RepID=A0A8T3DJR3_9TELE|nr:hypothetical protein AGOR_G00093070 [Albula goreensis]